MSAIAEEETKAIRRTVEAEFPEDRSLQQVHIGRKIIAREAELEGVSFLEYVTSLGKQANDNGTLPAIQ